MILCDRRSFHRFSAGLMKIEYILKTTIVYRNELLGFILSEFILQIFNNKNIFDQICKNFNEILYPLVFPEQ